MAKARRLEMEHAIGERITLEVVEVKERTCNGCFFQKFYDCYEIGKCWDSFRTDNKNIIYKEIKEDKQ